MDKGSGLLNYTCNHEMDITKISDYSIRLEKVLKKLNRRKTKYTTR